MGDRYTVLMTTDAVGGVWRYSVDLARELACHAVSTKLIVLGPSPSQEQRSEVASIPDSVLYEYPCDLEWMDEPWEGVARSGEYLLALASQCSPDIVHLNGYAHAALPFNSPKLVVAHSCVLSWWQAVKREPAPARYDRYQRAVANGLRHADEIVAPTAAMLAQLRTLYGVERGTVIPNGIANLDMPRHEKEHFVLCAGRAWDEAKNVRTLAAAAKGLSIPVYVAGKGSDHLSGVTPLGNLSSAALQHWFQRAGIYAAPAYYEPFGLAILEAATHGGALVLGDIPSLRELWSDAALYVPPADQHALRAALELLARHDSLRQTMADRARLRARAYSATQQAQAYLSLYRRMKAHRQRSADREGARRTSSSATYRSEPCEF